MGGADYIFRNSINAVAKRSKDPALVTTSFVTTSDKDLGDLLTTSAVVTTASGDYMSKDPAW
jgi:hypothetical protein